MKQIQIEITKTKNGNTKIEARDKDGGVLCAIEKISFQWHSAYSISCCSKEYGVAIQGMWEVQKLFDLGVLPLYSGRTYLVDTY